MSNGTEELIQRLASDATAVRPLPPPWTRTSVWLAVSAPYVAIVLLAMVLHKDLPKLTMDTNFLVELASGLAAAFTAALCAFGSVVPAYGRRFFVPFALSATIWIGSVGQQCIQEWLRNGAQALSLSHDQSCLPFIALLASYPAIAMVLMLRRGAPLTPALTAATVGIAAAGLGNFALRLVFPEDANLGLMVWHIGGVFVLAALIGSAGHRLLNWQSITGASKNISR